MDTLYFWIAGMATTLDVQMIHGYIVFPNYWGDYHIGCQMHNKWIIHGYIVFQSYFVMGRVLSLTTLPSLAQNPAPDKVIQECNLSMDELW